jgi:hypothetical protein
MSVSSITVGSQCIQLPFSAENHWKAKEVDLRSKSCSAEFHPTSLIDKMSAIRGSVPRYD